MTRNWLACARWTVAGVALGLLLLVLLVFVLMPIIIYPATVIASAPFLALILWLAWLVTQRVRGSGNRKSTALLLGALLPLIVMAADSILLTPQAIMFVGA